MSFTLLFLIFSGVLGIGMTCYFFWEESRKNESLPEHPATPETQMTSDELDKLLIRCGISEGTFNIPQEHLPLHQSFIHLASKYSKITFGLGPDEFDRTLMKVPYPENPLFLQIGEEDSIGMVLIRRNSTDPTVYIADYHDDMSNPTVYTSSLRDYLVLSWEGKHR